MQVAAKCVCNSHRLVCLVCVQRADALGKENSGGACPGRPVAPSKGQQLKQLVIGV